MSEDLKNIAKIENVIRQNLPVTQNTEGQTILFQSKAKQNLKDLKKLLAATDHIPVNPLLDKILMKFSRQSERAEDEKTYRMTQAMQVIAQNPQDIIGWAESKKRKFKFAPKKAALIPQFLTSAFMQYPRLVETDNFRRVVDVIKTAGHVVNVKDYIKKDFIQAIVKANPKLALKYAQDHEYRNAVFLYAADDIKTALAKKKLKRNPDVINLANTLHLVRSSREVGSSHSRPDPELLDVLVKLPSDDKLTMITEFRRTPPEQFDSVVKATLLVSLFSENKGLENYPTLIPTSRELIANWKKPAAGQQKMLKEQLQSFVGDRDIYNGKQMTLDF